MIKSFVGRAKPIDDIDLPLLGSKMRVGEDEIHAFIDAETSGSGFDNFKRPKALFEPHRFYRELSGQELTNAITQGLAYKTWKTKPYPKDSYPRIIKAQAINETAALKATSWGLGQIMGDNHLAAGYPTVQAMVKAFMDDEENQLAACVNFIINKKLDVHLRNHNWKAFAHGYNGPLFEINKYDEKLEDGFNKWKRIKDTPFNSNRPINSPTKPVITQPITVKPKSQKSLLEVFFNIFSKQGK